MTTKPRKRAPGGGRKRLFGEAPTDTRCVTMPVCAWARLEQASKQAGKPMPHVLADAVAMLPESQGS